MLKRAQVKVEVQVKIERSIETEPTGGAQGGVALAAAGGSVSTSGFVCFLCQDSMPAADIGGGPERSLHLRLHLRLHIAVNYNHAVSTCGRSPAIFGRRPVSMLNRAHFPRLHMSLHTSGPVRAPLRHGHLKKFRRP